MSNVKIKDSDYENFVKTYSREMQDYAESLQQYVKDIDSLLQSAVVSGEVHDTLLVFRQKFANVLSMPDVAAKSMKQAIDTYLVELDNAQKINGVSILYDKKYSGYKDYTSAYFRELKKMAESDDYDSSFWAKLWDLSEDLDYSIARFFGFYDNSKSKNIKATHGALLQYKDVTRLQVGNIERRIVAADESCKGKLDVIDDFIGKMCDYIMVFKEIMVDYQNNPSSIDISNIDFDSKYGEMMQAFNDVQVLETVTDEDVENFIHSEGSEQIMFEQVQIAYGYLGDLSQMDMSDVDFWKLVVLQMFNISEGQIASGGEYSKLVMKKELTDMLDDLAKSYVYAGSDEQEALNTVNSIFKEAKEHGKNIYDYLNSLRDENGKLILDGRTKKAKEFMRFLDGLGNAQDILKYGDQAIDILSRLFVDYDTNLMFLDSFERNTRLSDEMSACFAELKATYNHDLMQTAVDISRQVAEDGVQALYTISVGSMVGKVKAAIGLVGEVTGEGDRTAAQLELFIYGNDMVRSSYDAFLESMRKLKAASQDAENYSQLVNDFKNCFSLCKNSLTRVFEKMAVSAEGTQRDYFYYCSSEVSSMTLKDFSNPDFMSYEEYIKMI